MSEAEPFLFFNDRVTRDVAAASELLSPRTLRVKGTMQLLSEGLSLQVDSTPRGTRAEMCSTDWRLRVAGLLNLDRRHISSDVAQHCLAMAFDDPDERVRGTAWLSIAECLRSMETKNLSVACEMALRERFAWHDDSPQRQRLMSPRVWLECLERHSDLLDMRQQLDTIGREIETKDEPDLIALADVDRDALAVNLDSIVTFLEHPDSTRRCAGLIVLRRRRQCAGRVAEMVWRVATTDRDLRVRIRAIEAISAIYEGTQDRSAMRGIAALVIDSTQPCKVRVLAYDVLLCIDNRPYNERTVVIAQAGAGLRFPEDVDWDFVHRCAHVQLP